LRSDFDIAYDLTAYELLTTEPKHPRCTVWMYIKIEIYEVDLGSIRTMSFVLRSMIILKTADMSQHQETWLLGGKGGKSLQAKDP
jgi:hypothetical protein